ncbi:MAG TPA: hypothetical protein VMF11_10890 [Candidatus Baltobacteraceae bacterium]|nr:hypothetical protein [Candidatus Baltobacteraceae bacterium]
MQGRFDTAYHVSCRHRLKISHANYVVNRRSKRKLPSNAIESSEFCLAHRPDGFHPSEALFDLLSNPLADGPTQHDALYVRLVKCKIKVQRRSEIPVLAAPNNVHRQKVVVVVPVVPMVRMQMWAFLTKERRWFLKKPAVANGAALSPGQHF